VRSGLFCKPVHPTAAALPIAEGVVHEVSSMKLGRVVTPALLAAAILVPGPVLATAKIYDMAPLLNEPDPFQPVVPPTYRPARHAPAPPVVPAPTAPIAPAPPRMPPLGPAPAATPISLPAAMPAQTAPRTPTPLMIPIGRAPTSDSTIRPVGRLPTGITPQR
jgi:hypothetical protein